MGMPGQRIEERRRGALVEAAIREVGDAGSTDVTVARIARRAGVSSALAHHYFGTKEGILLAAMRRVLTLYAAEVRGALAMARTPRERVRAILVASLSPGSFRTETVAAWMAFYASAQHAPEAARLLAVYQRRLESNLRHALRPHPGAARAARGAAAMIDGIYLREALGPARRGAGEWTDLVMDCVERACPAS